MIRGPSEPEDKPGFWGAWALVSWIVGLVALTDSDGWLCAAFAIPAACTMTVMAVYFRLELARTPKESPDSLPKPIFSEHVRRKLWGGTLTLLSWIVGLWFVDSGKWVCAGPTIMYAIAVTAKTILIMRELPSEPVTESEVPEPSTGQGNEPGKVYIVQAGRHYKIGITQGDVSRRVAQLQTGSPQKIHIVHVIETDCPIDLERDLHKMLAHKRGEGEWFRLSEEELRIIKRLK